MFWTGPVLQVTLLQRLATAQGLTGMEALTVDKYQVRQAKLMYRVVCGQKCLHYESPRLCFE